MRIASRTSAVFLAVFAAAGMATAPELPAPVAAWIAAAADTCREVEGTPQVTDLAVRRADLNGDGAEDYVLTVEGVNCEGAASIYGDREKAMAVFAGDGRGGATEAFTDSVFGVDVRTGQGKPVLWLTVLGRQCGKPPAKDFASENFCERPLAWDAARRRFDYAPVSRVRMIQ